MRPPHRYPRARNTPGTGESFDKNTGTTGIVVRYDINTGTGYFVKFGIIVFSGFRHFGTFSMRRTYLGADCSNKVVTSRVDDCVSSPLPLDASLHQRKYLLAFLALRQAGARWRMRKGPLISGKVRVLKLTIIYPFVCLEVSIYPISCFHITDRLQQA